MRTKALNSEVLYPDEETVRVARPDVAALAAQAERNVRQRMRLCAHRGVEDPVHEMVIAVSRDVYLRPHKHLGRTESAHVVEGQADLVIFTDLGEVREVIRLGDYRSGRTFFIRMSEPHYHMLLVRSEMFVFHEVVQGPFERQAIAFAPWAPEEGDTAGRNEFLRRVAEAAARFP